MRQLTDLNTPASKTELFGRICGAFFRKANGDGRVFYVGILGDGAHIIREDGVILRQKETMSRDCLVGVLDSNVLGKDFRFEGAPPET